MCKILKRLGDWNYCNERLRFHQLRGADIFVIQRSSTSFLGYMMQICISLMSDVVQGCTNFIALRWNNRICIFVYRACAINTGFYIVTKGPPSVVHKDNSHSDINVRVNRPLSFVRLVGLITVWYKITPLKKSSTGLSIHASVWWTRVYSTIIYCHDFEYMAGITNSVLEFKYIPVINHMHCITLKMSSVVDVMPMMVIMIMIICRIPVSCSVGYDVILNEF